MSRPFLEVWAISPCKPEAVGLVEAVMMQEDVFCGLVDQKWRDFLQVAAADHAGNVNHAQEAKRLVMESQQKQTEVKVAMVKAEALQGLQPKKRQFAEI
jgi:hypothetical protein